LDTTPQKTLPSNLRHLQYPVVLNDLRNPRSPRKVSTNIFLLLYTVFNFSWQVQGLNIGRHELSVSN